MITQHARGPADRLENPSLAQATLTHQDNVLAAAYEVTRGQLLDRPPIDPLGIERPVKTFQGGQFAELGRTNPPVDCPLPTILGRLRQQAMEERQVAQ